MKYILVFIPFLSFAQIGYNPIKQKQWYQDTTQFDKPMRIKTGAGNGKILTSNSEGIATWQTGGGGATGATGVTGATGSQGIQGITGENGTNGSNGATGANGDRYSTTSLTTFTIPNVNNTVTFTVGTGLAYTANQNVIVTPTADLLDHLHGYVTAYNSATGSMTIHCEKTNAAGESYSSWTVNLDGAVGQIGATGATGATGTAGSNGTNGATGATGASESVTLITSDVVNANVVANTIADVTGLSFSVTSGKTYHFKFVIPYTAAATTTGSRWSINGAAITLLSYSSTYTFSQTGQTTISAGAYDVPNNANTTSLATGNMCVIEGIVKCSANGTIIARFASEVSLSAITAQAGAIVFYKQLD